MTVYAAINLFDRCVVKMNAEIEVNKLQVSLLEPMGLEMSFLTSANCVLALTLASIRLALVAPADV